MTKILKNKTLRVIIIIFILIIGYFVYKNLTKKNYQTFYLLTEVKKDSIIVSVSGSGQISTSDQIEIKPKISGELLSLNIKEGQFVKAGTLIARLNDKDLQKNIRDAEISLESAKISLEKLKKPVDELSLLQAENALINAKETKQKAENDLKKTGDDGFNTVANAFLDLPSIMSGFYEVLFNTDLRSYQWNIDYYADVVKNYDPKVVEYRDETYEKYQIARASYDKNFENYKSTNRYSGSEKIISLIEETYETTKKIAEAIKSANNLIQFYKDKLIERDLKPNPKADTAISSLSTYTGKTNSHLLSLLTIKNTIENSLNTIASAERTIKEKEESLKKLKEGPDELDLRSAELNVKQRENALSDAKEKLKDYYLYAPIDGIIASVADVKIGDSISSATVLATLVAKQKIAEISLNEADAVKIKVGQKATLTFDALPDLTLTGKVSEIDTIGTVSQGVVSYGIKIVLDTDDEKIKPGMSVMVNIITDFKDNVLVLPNSAIKTQVGNYYVELVEVPEEKKEDFLNNRSGVVLTTQPKKQFIEIGLANDSLTEIVFGLNEGEIVISSTISSTRSQTTQSSGQFQIPGMSPQIRMR